MFKLLCKLVELLRVDLSCDRHWQLGIERLRTDDGMLPVLRLLLDHGAHVLEEFADADFAVSGFAGVPISLSAHALQKEMREDSMASAPLLAFARGLVCSCRRQERDTRSRLAQIVQVLVDDRGFVSAFAPAATPIPPL